MNLIIDIGNTLTKLFAFQDGEPVEELRSEGHDLSALASFAMRHPFKAGIISSVVDLTEAARERLEQLPFPVLTLTPATATPIRNLYRTPTTLGSDRLAAAIGAHTLKQGHPLLIIDAGSCITFDFVSAEGDYVGGNISLGLHARLRALDEYFPRLPKVEAEGDVPELGYDTTTALRAGVIQGMRHEIEGYIRHFRQKYADLLVFLTGGDEINFDSTIKSLIFADHFIVARGLNAILVHNRSLLH